MLRNLLIFGCLASAFVLPDTSDGAVRPGVYRCHALAQSATPASAVPVSFTIVSATEYRDSTGKSGEYIYDRQTRRVSFQTGPMTGVMLGTDIVYQPNPANLTFSLPGGKSLVGCDRQR